jgi:hypothetical protein
VAEHLSEQLTAPLGIDRADYHLTTRPDSCKMGTEAIPLASSFGKPGQLLAGRVSFCGESFDIRRVTSGHSKTSHYRDHERVRALAN